MRDVTIAILAGGRSRRMGRNKSFVSVQGKPMIEHILESLTPLNVPKIIITNSAYDYRQYHLPLFADVIPDQGALGGIYTALYHSATPYALCVACDMPFLNIQVIQHILSLRETHDAVAVCINNVWQPFPAVYHKNLAPSLREAIDSRRLQMQKILNQMAIYPVVPEDIQHIDPDLRSFTNINTPTELEIAQR
jgi:molybdenum cofactor guanylyltransferase